MTSRRLGLIVNPIAGMGGRVGLKGTDGPDMVERARALGAVPLSAERAKVALDVVAQALGGQIDVITASGPMGEAVARACGFDPRVVGPIISGVTTAADTRRAAEEIAALQPDLILFAGGDGTARDVCSAFGTELPVVGIPTGVKMHSAVYATHPRSAGEAAVRVLAGSSPPFRDAEVMDIDEEAFRSGRLSAKLYGYLRVPAAANLIQGLKSGRGGGETAELAAVAAEMADRMRDDAIYVVGPGTTTRAIADHLGFAKTLLGVDVVYRHELVARDVTERQLLDHVASGPARIIVTPIGGQGYLFGRGNQQISADVIERVGRANLIVIATPSKLSSLQGHPFLVDTGDPSVDLTLSGYIRVITGYRSETVYRIQ